MPNECERCKRLFDEVEGHLNHISEVSKEQASALARKDEPWVDRLDHELERLHPRIQELLASYGIPQAMHGGN